jgi:hypothetical protein
MRMLYAAALSVGLLCPIGCEQKSGTAPSTDPAKPGAVRKLTIRVSGDHTITQDKTDEVMINVDRDNFSGPVTLDVRSLPKGVSVDTKEMTVPADKPVFTLTLKAAPDAQPVVDHKFQIVAKAQDIPEVVTDVKLTVKSK